MSGYSFDFFYVLSSLPRLLQGLVVSLELTAIAVGIGTFSGLRSCSGDFEPQQAALHAAPAVRRNLPLHARADPDRLVLLLLSHARERLLVALHHGRDRADAQPDGIQFRSLPRGHTGCAGGPSGRLGSTWAVTLAPRPFMSSFLRSCGSPLLSWSAIPSVCFSRVHLWRLFPWRI